MLALRADINAFRTFATAFAAATLCAFAVATSAGAEASGASGGAGFVQQPLAAPSGAFAGREATIKGHIDDYTGTVSITARRGGKGDFLPVGSARADAQGDFTFSWKPGKSGLYSLRLTPAGPAATSVAPANGTLSVYRRQKATWYGPGWYGTRTACGTKLTKRTLGVAHKTLPCGTKVEFFLRGKRITVPVIDRGPYANAAVWDLTLATMRRLGSSSTEFVGALPLG